MTKISKIPILPLYPIPWHFGHPLALHKKSIFFGTVTLAFGEIIDNIFLKFSIVIFAGWYFSLQWGQSFLNNLWAIQPLKAELIKVGLIPKSMIRGMTPAELLAWTVEKTKCPVKAEWIAISAVSSSRISPTRRMSGSCLTIALKPLAKV